MGDDERMAVPGAVQEKEAVEDPSDRRNFDRYDVEWAVDCVASDTFLYASITNISEMGIFVRTDEPLTINTKLRLSFAPPGATPFKLEGCVAWVNCVRDDGDNPNPGMGIRFVDLRPEERERLVEVIRTIAYLRDLPRYD
ncbi:MAG: TIGR02266 family protein [Labilithrix sp.]|nr:TIGR02266 family protein [Labilithrix sp.]